MTVSEMISMPVADMLHQASLGDLLLLAASFFGVLFIVGFILFIIAAGFLFYRYRRM